MAAKKIKTNQGDTWDTVAFRVYGDAKKAQLLMETRENIRLLDIQVFPAGVVITAPELPEVDNTADLPSWRR